MKLIGIGIALLALLATPVLAQHKEFIVFPKKDQTPEQQKQDEEACYTWSKDQSSFDPKAPPVTETAPPPKQAKKGGLLRGAARGAVLGEITTGDASEGAAVGAAIGVMRGNDQKRDEAQKQAQWEQQEGAAYAEKRNTYNRAYKACMEGKGYALN